MATHLAERYALFHSTEWGRLLQHLSWWPDYACLVLLVPDNDVGSLCRWDLERFLRERDKTLHLLPLEQPAMLERVAGALLARAFDESVGAVWVQAATPEASSEQPAWRAAWASAAQGLNQARDRLRWELPAPVIFVGAPWVETLLCETAPDFWSRVALVVRIETTAPGRREMLPQEDRLPRALVGRPEASTDPVFALEEAEHIRHRPELAGLRARILLRAGRAFRARSDPKGAEVALIDAEAAAASGGNARQVAEILLALGETRLRSDQHAQAITDLTRAQGLYQQVGDRLGEAHCILSLGEIALYRGEYGEAGAQFSRAQGVYQQVGDRLGEANCIRSHGHSLLMQGSLDGAREWLEQARRLHRELPDPDGEAEAEWLLGLVALEADQPGEAAGRLDAALVVARQIGARLTQARVLSALGDLHARLGEPDRARECYAEAHTLFDQMGNAVAAAEVMAKALREPARVNDPETTGRMPEVAAAAVRGAAT